MMLTILILIDMANLMWQAKKMRRKIDYIALIRFLANLDEGRRLVDAYLYTSLPPENAEAQIRFFDVLRYNGINVVTKRGKRLPNGEIKANVDSLLILDAMELVPAIKPDVVVLVTGDGDFAPLAQRIRKWGIRVEVAGTHDAMANELRMAANGVIDLDPFLSRCPGWDGEVAPAIGTEAILNPL
jgi:uncharacterized LabA/DUF88 family protein